MVWENAGVAEHANAMNALSQILILLVIFIPLDNMRIEMLRAQFF